jgi:hypothetical protein
MLIIWHFGIGGRRAKLPHPRPLSHCDVTKRGEGRRKMRFSRLAARMAFFGVDPKKVDPFFSAPKKPKKAILAGGNGRKNYWTLDPN